MTTLVTVGADAADPKRGMTIDEMAQFVQRAMHAGCTGDEKVDVTLNWHRGARKLEVTVRSETPEEFFAKVAWEGPNRA